MKKLASLKCWSALVTITTLVACSSAGEEEDSANDAISSELSTTGIFKGLAGKCLDASGTGNGSKVVLSGCDGSAAQKWTVSGSEIRSAGGRCLDVTANNAANGTAIVLWDCHGRANQKWTVQGNRVVGLGGKCLDVQARGTADGTPIILWACSGQTNQRWSFQASGTAPAPAPTPAPSPSPAGGLTIAQVISDMSSPSEVIPIDPRFDWQHKPGIGMYAPRGDAIPSWWTGNRPEWCYSELSWFVAQEGQGNKATNSRVQLKDLRVFIQSQSTRKWSLLDSAAKPYTEMWKYPFAYVGPNGGARTESTGGISIKPRYPEFQHGYGNPKGITPQDVRAVFVAMDFRLTVDDPSKPDDRASARYVVDTGADYWPGNGQATWSLGYAPGVGNGRMMLATNNWRTATLLVPNKNYGSTYEDIRNNPPPLD